MLFCTQDCKNIFPIFSVKCNSRNCKNHCVLENRHTKIFIIRVVRTLILYWSWDWRELQIYARCDFSLCSVNMKLIDHIHWRSDLIIWKKKKKKNITIVKHCVHMIRLTIVEFLFFNKVVIYSLAFMRASLLFY